MSLADGWVLNPAVELTLFANLRLLVVFLELRCPHATLNGCTNGKAGSRRWTITAWCVRWSGGWIGRTTGPGATAAPLERPRAIFWNISRVSTIASFERVTTFTLIGLQPISGWSVARCKFSAR